MVERDNGQVVDRFRNRLMIPIARDTGSVVAFGGRAMDADQVPKYLNSPETPIYTKSRTLYGLNHTKPFLRKSGFVVLVEGYFDFAQVFQECRLPVVASCGTALTPQQAQMLRRFVSKVVLSFDPDAAGQGAAARSCEMLVAEGFQVNVAVLPGGDDPDTFIRNARRHAVRGRSCSSRSRTWSTCWTGRWPRTTCGATRAGGRSCTRCWRWPPASRTRRCATSSRTGSPTGRGSRNRWSGTKSARRPSSGGPRSASAELPSFGQLKPAERGLLWALLNQSEEALGRPGGAGAGRSGRPGGRPASWSRRCTCRPTGELTSPAAFLARLTSEEAQLLTGIAAAPTPPAPASECALALRRLRLEREGAAVQREIDRLQETGDGASIDRLWQQKRELLQRIATLEITGT